MSTVFVSTRIPEEARSFLAQAVPDAVFWDQDEVVSEDNLIDNLKNCSVLVSAVNINVTAKVIEAAPALKLIANIGDGFSNIDIEAAEKKGIVVTNAPTRDSIASTAEQTVTLLLALSRLVIEGDRLMRAHQFKGWRVTGYTGGHQVYGKKVLIVGLGRVGKIVARILAAFEADLYYTDPVEADAGFAKEYGLKKVSLEEGLPLADYVTLNCALTSENGHMFRRQQFELMKKTAYFINCARGPLISEADLAAVLKGGGIAGAALDVFEFEPEVGDDIATLPNVVLAPHAGNATVEARNEMALDAVGNAIHFLNNEPLQYRVV